MTSPKINPAKAGGFPTKHLIWASCITLIFLIIGITIMFASTNPFVFRIETDDNFVKVTANAKEIEKYRIDELNSSIPPSTKDAGYP